MMTLVEAAEAIAARRVSSRELTEAALERFERLDPVLNCAIALDAEAALAAAEKADETPPKGPLHGVPLAHKDMFYRAGRVSTLGSKFPRDKLEVTATALARLDAAGAVDLGTLNMAEFAFGPTGHNYHFGHCRNPWNTDCVTGGSSSGSGASVAAGLVFGALGSDTGGSIRLPAAFCGIVGMKPTWSRVSRFGAMPLSFSLDTIGPLARRVRDCARLLGVIAGADPEDPTSSAAPVPDFEAACGEKVEGMRLGIAPGAFTREVAEPVTGAIEKALGVWRELGCEIVELKAPDLDEMSALYQFVAAAEAVAVHAESLRQRPGDYSDQVRTRLQPGFAVTALQYLEAVRARPQVTAGFVEAVLGKCDALVAPVTPFASARIEDTDVGGGPEMFRVLGEFTRFTRPINYLGLPALSLPCGFEQGMPIGLQLVGRPFAEATLFRLGHAYEAAAEWYKAEPTL
jgi:aspartyl-tRNA(Asn)/glutamyl-tRNA(Gln) amidotransferase subunit A